MKPEIQLKKLRQRQFSLQYQLQQLEAPDLPDRDMDWFDTWAYLHTQIDRLTREIAELEKVAS